MVFIPFLMKMKILILIDINKNNKITLMEEIFY